MTHREMIVRHSPNREEPYDFYLGHDGEAVGYLCDKKKHGDDYWRLTREDAERLALCWNSHEPLLAALDAIIEFDNENVLVVEGRGMGTEEDKALNKILVMVANAIEAAKP